MRELISILFSVTLATPCFARTITVDDDGPADFNTIQAAINDANDGDTVIVWPGWYTENINLLGKNIILRSTNPTDPNVAYNPVIDGGGSGSAVTFAGNEDPNCVLAGFNITYGVAVGGAFGSPQGGGICGNGTLATIQYNWIHHNRAICQGFPCAAFGAGLYDCDGIIQHNFIYYNDARGDGGSWGGGWGGGLSECDGTVLNNTIFYNSALPLVNGGSGGGLESCNGTIRNCIIWWNIPDQIYNCGPDVTYSDIEGGYTGEGNINADPCFVAAGPYVWQRFHLKSQAGRWDPNSQSWAYDSNTSLCIDAGNPGCPPADEPAPNGNRINMGAYGGTAEASKSPENCALLADLTNDHKVDSNDLRVFVNYWLQAGQCIPSDLSRDEFVDFLDFAIFGLQWRDTTIAEPTIEYEITPCGMGMSVSQPNSPTRFTVTIEGSYLHFEDMMVANCCPDKVWLEMELNGNQITIYEREVGGMCTCICDYPVRATLGPFEPGTYTLEVYEDWGGFIASTTVTIGPGQ